MQNRTKYKEKTVMCFLTKPQCHSKVKKTFFDFSAKSRGQEKPQYRRIKLKKTKNSTKNEAKPHHRNPYAPLIREKRVRTCPKPT